MPALPMRGRAQRDQPFFRDRVIEHRADAANREAEDQAFDVEAGVLRQIDQARRVPVFRNVVGLGQAEQRRERVRAPQTPRKSGRRANSASQGMMNATDQASQT